MSAILPLQRWTRDDWAIPCTVQDPSGTAVNLTGQSIAAEFWIAGYAVMSPLTVANGGIVRVSDAAGQFRVVVPRLLTAKAPADAGALSPAQRTRVLIYRVDTLGQRQTLGVIAFEVFDGSEGRLIDPTLPVLLVSQNAAFTIVVAASQGDPGPSSIPAEQVTNATDVGRSVMKAASKAAARAALEVPSNSPAVVSDTNYAAKATDTYVGFSALTAPRTVTLPAASDFPRAQPLWIADETGNCSTDRPIIAAALGSDTIAGQANVSAASPYQKLCLHSNGSNLWTVQ